MLIHKEEPNLIFDWLRAYHLSTTKCDQCADKPLTGKFI
jgi:hypothetical protein